jgi:glycolate oxidase iron-sulfur subunit
VVLGDGALWIRDLAEEHFPGAIQIVDRFHTKEHLSSVATAAYGVTSELGRQWAHQRHVELDAGDLAAVVRALETHATAHDERRECGEYIQRFFLPQVNVATVHALAENGFEVVTPREQGCCGSLLAHEGERERAKVFARKTVDVFERAGVDCLVTNAAGCGSVMKEYWELLQGDPAWRSRAEAFSKKVRDASELLAQAPLNGRLHELPLKVTYHDACHLAHGQKVRQQPRNLLKAMPGLQLVEMAESDFCCGSAGVYNVLHPEVAGKFLERKIARIQDTGAEAVVSANPGCTLQIERGLRDRGLTIPVLHPMELLERCYRGTPAGAGRS